MTVRLDFVEDATVTQDAGGIQAIRRARITGIAGPATLRQRQALDAPGLPRFGDPHPAWGDLKVVAIQVDPVDVQTFDAQITYRVPTPQELAHMGAGGTVIDRQWFAVTVTEELNQDVNGERLYHWYTGNPVAPSIVAGSGVVFQRSLAKVLVWKNELAEVQRPSVGARIIMSDRQSVQGLLDFSGTINQAFWSGFPPQTWLIGGIDSRLDRDRWINSFELFYKPDTWKFRSVVEYFGAPPSDATLGNGIADFDVYQSANFNRLPFQL